MGEGASFTLHLPEELDIAQFYDTIRNAHTAALLAALDICAELGIEKMNMHMGAGVYFTLPERKLYLYDKYRDLYLSNIIGSLDVIAPRLESTGIALLIENTGIFGMGFVQDAVDRLLECPNVGLTWDIGHDYSSGRIDSMFIEERADRVQHMHLHDAVGASNHLPLYSGEIDMAPMLDFARRHACSCVIETKTVRGLELSVQGLEKARTITRRIE
jgi:sugar phosphate isomerase/epimerase